MGARFGPYFCDPVVAGLDPKTNEPFICSMDLIGCINFAKDFVVAGTCSPNLYGMCEALYRPDMVRRLPGWRGGGAAGAHALEGHGARLRALPGVQEPEDLFETMSQALVNAFDRDALSGWGAVVHIMYVAPPLRTVEGGAPAGG